MPRAFSTLLSILVVLGIGIPLWRWIASAEAPPPAAPPRDLGPVPVRVEPVVPREVEITVEAFGNLEARRRVQLTSEVSGRVVELLDRWRSGALVEEGELLLRIDPELYELAVGAAQASLEEALAGVAAIEVDQERLAREEQKAQESRDLAVREHERLVELGGFASESLRDQSRLVRLDAELLVETTRIGVEGAAAALAAAQARASSARVALSRAEADLARTEVRAPFRGRLVGGPPGMGTVAAPGLVLGELVDPDSLVLVVRVPERDLLGLRVGMPADVTFPADPELVDRLLVPGRVAGIDAVSDVATRRGRVEVELDASALPRGSADGEDVADLLPAGLFARARIGVDRVADALWIDRRHFVWNDVGEPVAYVVRPSPENPEELRVERRILTFTRSLGEGFLVGRGLAPGDRLAVSPLDRLDDGVAVRELEERGRAPAVEGAGVGRAREITPEESGR